VKAPLPWPETSGTVAEIPLRGSDKFDGSEGLI